MKRNTLGRIVFPSNGDIKDYYITIPVKDMIKEEYVSSSFDNIVDTKFRTVDNSFSNNPIDFDEVVMDNNAIILKTTDLNREETRTEKFLNGKVVAIDWNIPEYKLPRETFTSTEWPYIVLNNGEIITNSIITLDTLYAQFYSDNGITQTGQIYLFKYDQLFRFSDLNVLTDYMSLNGLTTVISNPDKPKEILYQITFLSDSIASQLTVNSVVIEASDLTRSEDNFPIKRPNVNETLQELFQKNIPDIVLNSLPKDNEYAPLFVNSFYVIEDNNTVPQPILPLNKFQVLVDNELYKGEEILFDVSLTAANSKIRTLQINTTYPWVAYLNTDNPARVGLFPVENVTGDDTINVSSVYVPLYGAVESNKLTSKFQIWANNVFEGESILTIIPNTNNTYINNSFKVVIPIKTFKQ